MIADLQIAENQDRAALPEGVLAGALTALAQLLEYPAARPGVEARITAAARLLKVCVPAVDAAFQDFASAFLTLPAEAREELFGATFDITPACVPYVSIHLFGEENFKRGEFMAALAARYQQTNFSANDELPDHLGNLLRYTARADAAERRELLEHCLLGPVDRMIAALTPDNPYRALLETIRRLLRSAHPGLEPALSPLEQMRRHGQGCAVATPACGCGAQPPEPETFLTR